MTGRHRSGAQSRAGSVVKSAAWLLPLALLALALPLVLGLVAFGIYVALAHKSDTYPVAIALQGMAWVLVGGDLTLTLLRKRPRSAAQLVSVATKICALLAFTIGLLSTIGHLQGWAARPVELVLIGLAGLIMAYLLVGQRFLRTFLESRTSRPRPS